MRQRFFTKPWSWLGTPPMPIRSTYKVKLRTLVTLLRCSKFSPTRMTSRAASSRSLIKRNKATISAFRPRLRISIWLYAALVSKLSVVFASATTPSSTTRTQTSASLASARKLAIVRSHSRSTASHASNVPIGKLYPPKMSVSSLAWTSSATMQSTISAHPARRRARAFSISAKRYHRNDFHLISSSWKKRGPRMLQTKQRI